MTSRVDLSKLTRPVIPGLVKTVDEVHAANLAWLADEYGWELVENASDPAWRATRLLAAREVLVRREIADGIEQVSLAYARADILDVVGLTYYGLERLDGELDDDYRQRLAEAPERYAVGLSGPWYESVARGVAGVYDARFTSPNPGEGTIYVQASEALLDAMGEPRYENGIPDAALLQAVTAVVTAEEARQQTDTITVAACTRQRYDLIVTVQIRAEPDSAAVLADAQAALARLAHRTDRLGGALDNALVAGAAINFDAVAAASVQIRTVDGDGVTADVDTIASDDSTAPQARRLTVTVTTA